jgi:hypothetical protein
MSRKAMIPCAAVLAALAMACGGKGEPQAGATDTTQRNLALAPAESVHALNDRPAPPEKRASAPTPAPKRETPPPKQPLIEKPKAEPPPTPPVTPPPEPAAPAPALATGAVVSLAAVDSVHSRRNHKGDPVMATVGTDVKDAQGRVVIPAGAVAVGTISDIDAGHPGAPGRLVLTFNRVQFGGKTYGVAARVDSMATVERGRGVTTEDAAKVGVGAVLGGIAGRIIGGNKTGTAVGAVAGAAAGAGVAHQTRDVDVVLPAGALVRLTLTAPFELKEIQ